METTKQGPLPFGRFLIKLGLLVSLVFVQVQGEVLRDIKAEDISIYGVSLGMSKEEALTVIPEKWLISDNSTSKCTFVLANPHPERRILNETFTVGFDREGKVCELDLTGLDNVEFRLGEKEFALSSGDSEIAITELFGKPRSNEDQSGVTSQWKANGITITTSPYWCSVALRD